MAPLSSSMEVRSASRRVRPVFQDNVRCRVAGVSVEKVVGSIYGMLIGCPKAIKVVQSLSPSLSL